MVSYEMDGKDLRMSTQEKFIAAAVNTWYFGFLKHYSRSYLNVN